MRFIFICLLVSLFSPIAIYCKKKKKEDLQANTIGTHLMFYFQKLIKGSLDDQEIAKPAYFQLKNEANLQKFYDSLPTRCFLTEEEKSLIRSFPSSIWSIKYPYNPSLWKELKEPYYLTYHAIVQSVSKRVIREALIKMGYERRIDCPVIHYRLGDVPFCRNKVHHLNKYDFYLWALKNADMNSLNKTILIITSDKHRSKPAMKNASLHYLEDFIVFLREKGYDPIIQSKSILEDFAKMVFAPILISGGSTFSFMAGLANNGSFYSSKMGQEKGRFFEGIDSCTWMYPFDPILHREIPSYFDTEKVFKKLRESDEI